MGEDGAAVPEGVAVGTRLVLDRIAPEDTAIKDQRRRLGHGRRAGGRSAEVSAAIAFSQAGEGVPARVIMVNAGSQSRQVAADQIELDVEEGAGARGGAKSDLADRRAEIDLLGNSGREVEKVADGLQAGHLFPGRARLGGDGLQGRRPTGGGGWGQGDRRQPFICLEEKGAVLKGEPVMRVEQGAVRMLRAPMIAPGCLQFVVIHGRLRK